VAVSSAVMAFERDLDVLGSRIDGDDFDLIYITNRNKACETMNEIVRELADMK
jgi:hypothetical protein